MDFETIFDESELDGLSGPQLQQKANEIKQRFDFTRAASHQYRNNPMFIESIPKIAKDLTEFDKNKFTPWNQKWNNIYRANNIDQLKKYFNEGIVAFKDLEPIIDNFQPFTYQSEQIEELKAEVLTRLESDMITLKSDVLDEIQTGIKSLINFKSELGLQQNFSKNIEDEKKRSNGLRITFLLSFIATLIALAAVLIFIPIENNNIWNIIILKVSITLPVGFLSYFLFSQYKLYQIINLKYTHLFGFVGGGATYLSQMIDNDNESKKNINIKLANMFMELDDIIGTIKQNKHPADESIDNALKIIDRISKTLGDVTDSVTKLKK